MLDWRFGLFVLGGLFFDVAIYKAWLKRRTARSILWGGLSGRMPALAGRVLSVGTIDWIGLAFCLTVVSWIPTHIMILNIRYVDDFRAAVVSTFPIKHGLAATRAAIGVSSTLAAAFMALTSYGIGMSWGYLRLLAVASTALVVLAARSTFAPSRRANHRLFNFASVYMLGAMLLIVATGV